MREPGDISIEKANLTERQIEYVDAFRTFQSNKDACRYLGVTVSHGMDMIREAIARSGLTEVDLIGRTLRTTRRADVKQATKGQLYQLIKDQDFRCALSGVKLEPYFAALDHKTPISKGGSDLIKNLQWVSESINKAKGTMTNEEFIEMCRRVAKWNS